MFLVSCILIIKLIFMKKIIFALLIFCFIVLLISACTSQTADTSFKTISINDHELRVELADTPAKQSQGLSGRESLPNNQGMLFIFDNYTQPGFWMKDMQFPLDIIWIRDNMIIDITENIPVPENNQLINYYPSEPINYVLEVNAGWVNKNNIKIGHKIKF